MRRAWLIALLPLLAALTVRGQEGLRLQWAGEGELRIEFTLGAYTLGLTPDSLYSQIEAEGLSFAHCHPGTPMLPSASRLVLLPAGARLVVSDVKETSTDNQLRRPLRRAPHASTKQTRPANPPSEVDLLQGPHLWAEHLGQMGGSEVYRLTVAPFQVDHSLRHLEAFTHISATAHIDLPPAAKAVRTAPRAEGYAIVAPPEFVEGLQPFIRWKRQTGHDVHLILAPTRSRDSIRARLEPLFANPAEAPTYLLLVGDAEQIQSYAGTTRPQGLSMHNTDLPYALYGDDYLPDVQLGRWPVRDTAELRDVVQKTLAYEQLCLADTAYLGRMLLVAGRENTVPAPTTTNGQVNYLASLLAQFLPGVDTLCFRNPASATQREDIQAAVRTGVGLVNYTGHGTTAGWSSPAVGFRALDSLEAQFPSVFINNCCKSSDFAGTCFAEQLLRKPGGGGVGVIGATNETLWNEDYYWAVGPKYPFSLAPTHDSLHPGALEQMADGSRRAQTLGQLVQAGCLAVSESGSPYDRFYWEIYTLFGDPSLMPWLGVPQAAQMAAEAADLMQGSTTVRVGGTPHARATLMQADSLMGTATLDAQGRATLRLRRPLDTLPLLLTTTGFGLAPRTDTLAVGPALPTGLLFHDIAHRADTLRFALLNPTADTLRSVSIGLGCPAPAANPLLIPLLPPLADTALAMPVAPADAECTLLALGPQGDTLGRQWLQLSRPWPAPAIRFHLLADADGSPARSLAPGTAYRFCPEADSGYTIVQATVSDSLTPLASGTAQALFTPLATTRHLMLQARAARGPDTIALRKWAVVGNLCDGFEAHFASHPWQHSTLYPWAPDSGYSCGGSLSVRSAPIDYRQTSDLGITLLLMEPDSISFCASASSEQDYDRLLFSIGDSTVLTLSGEAGWQRHAFALPRGESRLRWRYVKDESVSRGEDCAWIDNVCLPLALWDAPCGYFGPASALGTNPPAGADATSPPYPNPTTGTVGLAVDRPTAVGIYTLGGQLVSTRWLGTAGRHTIRVAERPGTYLLHYAGQTFKIIVTP